MTPKIEAVLRLIQKGEQDSQKLFTGLCLLLEVAEESPSSLDPVTHALISSVIRRLVDTTQEKMGVRENF